MGRILPFLFLLLLSAILGSCHGTTLRSAKNPKFSALLVFGDSTVDTGNNNYIPTLFVGNHPPYGRDLDGGAATGRFTNGLMVPDFLVSALRLKQRCPPFLDPLLSDDDTPTGVNFASAGSGFDEATTSVSGVISMSRQLEMFKLYLGRLENVAGKEKATDIVKTALILISAGTNDFILNYYDIPTRKIQFNIDQYQDFILLKVRDVIKEVYDLGGRRFAIAGLPPIGCTPVQMTAKLDQQSDKRVCIDDENFNAVAYNGKLQMLLSDMNLTLQESKIAYVNVYDPLLDMSTSPPKYGFEETKRGCCGTGLLESGPLCNSWSPTCPDASKYMFFDAIHPTENVYRILAKQIVDEVVPLL